MAEPENVQKVRQTTTRAGNTVQRTTEVRSPSPYVNHVQNVADRIVWFVTGVLLVLLGFRFLLSLLGANKTNDFANFIYSASHPFVAPFFSLFSYKELVYGVSRWEVYTLVAMLVYIVIAWGITALIDLTRR